MRMSVITGCDLALPQIGGFLPDGSYFPAICKRGFKAPGRVGGGLPYAH